MIVRAPMPVLAAIDVEVVVGFLLIFGIIAVAIAVDRRKRGRHPDQPWLWRKDWAAGRILSGEPDALLRYAVAGAMLLPLILAFLLVLDKPFTGPPLIFLLAFFAVEAALLVAAIRVLFRWRRFGRSVFDMRSVPGVIGGDLAGVIRVPTRLCPEDGFHLRLVCLHRFQRHSPRSSGQNRTSSVEVILWQEQQVAPFPRR